ncbi:MAG: DUF4296 domain-containing protein [Muricauda sp.]|uniref:DUF4296 domain-containing protein n=1 Tax=Flagellimonas lutaonensis TaxID=516051 RepID=A0A0D5YR13_9FLAO|nr:MULTISPECIES: DUF4296 domain-containing protein [Allomuricauda]AKA34720.1 hypothetical protein VC82_1074 [Allomuricauda lutaonensis]MAU25824.1 DUF4296 domain-containing protein [Allomuricauda sp.]MBC30031.1 DUF4296 domain-containing protein [Allomuricauda sp.]|tara:strand:+ start:4115 stop:4552 length:438 start_codon:yes stop_codon:yes gene_type:complete
MIRTFIWVLVILCCCSCAEKVVEKPENLLSEEQMTDILYDLAILQAAKSTNKSILRTNDIDAMRFIYNKHGIDSAQLASSDLYYASLPLKYQAIYENVEARLEMQAKILEKARKEKTDSLRNVTKKRSDSSISAKSIKKIPENQP